MGAHWDNKISQDIKTDEGNGRNKDEEICVHIDINSSFLLYIFFHFYFMIYSN